MTYALDTNIISYALRGDTGLMRKIDEAEASYDGVIIPLLVYYEVRRGLEASGATAKAQLFERLCARLGVEDMTVADMNEAARIYAERKRQGKPMEDADLLIAAQAVSREYVLVTHNTRHFADISGLRIEDWVL